MKRASAAIMTALAILMMAVPAAAGVDTGIGVGAPQQEGDDSEGARNLPPHVADLIRGQAPEIDAQQDTDLGRAWDRLDKVRVATAKYHGIIHAIDDGFVPFALDGGDTPTCFDSESGGMGVHYVRNVDAVVDDADPEALVYELTEGGHSRLVGVEYIVPQEFVEDEDGNVVSLPHVLGQDFHKHATLPLYVLHAWIWEMNPDGMFADFNPVLGACPAVV
jgi:hypothetical protein